MVGVHIFFTPKFDFIDISPLRKFFLYNVFSSRRFFFVTFFFESIFHLSVFSWSFFFFLTFFLQDIFSYERFFLRDIVFLDVFLALRRCCFFVTFFLRYIFVPLRHFFRFVFFFNNFFSSVWHSVSSRRFLTLRRNFSSWNFYLPDDFFVTFFIRDIYFLLEVFYFVTCFSKERCRCYSTGESPDVKNKEGNNSAYGAWSEVLIGYYSFHLTVNS